jgi:Flp pilus assembly protein TadD
LVLEKLPLLALCGVSAVIAGWAKSGTQTLIRTDQALVERTGQAFYGLAFYVLKTVWPSGLVVIRELPDDISLLAIRFLIPMSGVTSLAVLLWLARKRLPAATAAFASYGLIVAPALGLVQFNTQLVADRYSYVACMPLAILLGGAWVAAFDRLTHGRWVHGVIAVSVVAVLFVATWRQSAVWRTSESLYLHALKFGETSKVLANLALVYNEKALEGTSRRTQLLDEALSLSTRALDHARASGLQDPQYHLTLGTIRLNRGELDRAITEIQTCLEDRPDFLQARIHLGIAFMRAERFQEAVSCLQRAVQIAPENADAWMLLAMAFDGSGNRFNALQAYRRVVTIDPGNATALDRLRILENTR